jgi:hypothetical protein
VKAGDLVTVIGSFPQREFAAVILEPWPGCVGWWTLMTARGIINWPHSQLRKINESR